MYLCDLINTKGLPVVPPRVFLYRQRTISHCPFPHPLPLKHPPVVRKLSVAVAPRARIAVTRVRFPATPSIRDTLYKRHPKGGGGL